jgi:hypothetical protein
MLGIVKLPVSAPTGIPSYNAIRLACRKKGTNMDMRFCRKIHGSWLHQHNMSSEEIDFLQGRTSTSVFSRHYLTPSESFERTCVILSKQAQGRNRAIDEKEQSIAGLRRDIEILFLIFTRNEDYYRTICYFIYPFCMLIINASS